MKDKVSVVMPVYKVEDCITVALESIVKQTYKNIELILVNDGSPDNSIPVAKDFLSKYDLDWKILDQQNMGLPTARNNGIKAPLENGSFVLTVMIILHLRHRKDAGSSRSASFKLRILWF